MEQRVVGDLHGGAEDDDAGVFECLLERVVLGRIDAGFEKQNVESDGLRAFSFQSFDQFRVPAALPRKRRFSADGFVGIVVDRDDANIGRSATWSAKRE